MGQEYKIPKNIDECNKIAWCFECIYYKETDDNICQKKKEFKFGLNPIFFLNFDPPV